MEQVIQIYNNDGTASSYKTVSARITGFLAEYGPAKGYRIHSSSMDYLNFTQGRLALSMALANQGSLPAEEAVNLLKNARVLFTCQLINKEGDVMAEASAVKNVIQLKDHETGETAAFQRLMAKLGHGGEIFDHDEFNDMLDQKLHTSEAQQTVKPSPVALIKSAPAVKVQAVKPKGETVKQEVVVEAEVKAEAQPEQVVPKSKSVVPAVKQGVTRSGGATKVDGTILQPGLLRQLASMARIKRVDCPTVTTPEELKSELTRLHALPIPD